MTALRELFASFAFDFDNTKLQQADASVDGFAAKIEGVAAALTGGLVARGVAQFAGELDVFDDLSAQTGILTDQLQLLGYAAKVNGSSQEEMFQSLNRLQSAMGRTAEAGGPVTEILKKMGIDTKVPRQLGEVLPEVLAGFSNLDTEAAQAQAAMTLFGRSGVRLLPVLRQGEAGMAALRAEFESFGGPVSAETIAKAGEFRDMVVRLDTAFFKLKGTLASAVFPQLSKVVESAAHGVARIGEWAKNTTLAETATVAFASSLTSSLWPALAPFLKGGLKFGAIFLAVDELVGFLQGHDSVIGRILDGWFGDGTADVVRDWVNDAIGEFGRLKDSAAATFEAIGDSNASLWTRAAALFLVYVRDMTSGFPLIRAAFSGLVADLETRLLEGVLSMQETWNGFIASLTLPDVIKSALQIDTSGTLESLQQAQADFAAAVDRGRAAEFGQVDGRPRSTLGQGLVTGAERQGRTVAQFDDQVPRASGAINLPARADAPPVVLLPGPVQPNLPPSFSMVQNTPVNIYLPAGTDARQAESIGRAAQRGIREANREGAREARQALVPRK